MKVSLIILLALCVSGPSFAHSDISLNHSNGFQDGSLPAFDYHVKIKRHQNLTLLEAHFEDYIYDGEGNPSPVKMCEFQTRLTRSQTSKVNSLISNLRICKNRGEEVSDAGFDGIFYMNRDTVLRMVNKQKQGFPENEEYFCRGSKALYSYISSIVVPKAPGTCPADYKSLFKF